MINSCVACGAILPAGAKVCEKCQWPVEGAEDTVEEIAEAEQVEEATDAVQAAGQARNQTNQTNNQANQTNNQANQQGQQPQMMYGQSQMYNGAQYQNQNMYGAQYQGQNGYVNPNYAVPNATYPNGNVYANQRVYPNNMYVTPNAYQNQAVYATQPQFNKATVPPGSTVYRGKVYTEEEIDKMMPSFKKYAVVSLIFGLLGFLFVVGNQWFVFTSLPGFVFSIVGTANAGNFNANPKRARDGRATAGKVFGILGIIFGIFAMIFSFVILIGYFGFGYDWSVFGLTGNDFSVFNYFGNF